MNKKSQKQEQESTLIDILGETMKLLKSDKKVFNKTFSDSLTSTLTDILKDNQTFLKMLADPNADIAVFEPIVKKMMKKKNGRRKS